MKWEREPFPLRVAWLLWTQAWLLLQLLWMLLKLPCLGWPIYFWGQKKSYVHIIYNRGKLLHIKIFGCLWNKIMVQFVLSEAQFSPGQAEVWLWKECVSSFSSPGKGVTLAVPSISVVLVCQCSFWEYFFLNVFHIWVLKKVIKAYCKNYSDWRHSLNILWSWRLERG